MTLLELVFMSSGLKRKTGGFWYVIKVTPIRRQNTYLSFSCAILRRFHFLFSFVFSLALLLKS